MSIVHRWLGVKGSQGSQVLPGAKKPVVAETESQISADLRGFRPITEREEEEESRTVRACRENPANPANPQTRADCVNCPLWIDRKDVVAAVEDLADEKLPPGKIARLLGLYRHEVVTILRRTAR